MALMNLYLHNIEPQIKLGDAIYEPADPRRFDVVLTNPPSGPRGEPGPRPRRLHCQPSNKRLNFVQHVLTILNRPAA
jgi:type I restriction enzyme M protein